MIGQVIFGVLLIAGAVLFGLRVKTIRRNILLGKDIDRKDRAPERWRNMIRTALGQGKMVNRPVAGILHIVIYVGFVLINIEMLEIVVDGLAGTHRIFSGSLGGFYNFLIAFFEILGAGVLIACVVFLIRRNVLRIRRFHLAEMTNWPKSDANIILVWESLLMFAFLSMNACDFAIQQISGEGSISFPVSKYLAGMYGDDVHTLHLIERFMWWFHIVGVIGFAVYVTYSKHLHIFLAFPNTYYANLEPYGRFNNMEAVKKEVQLMMDPNADPFAAPAPAEGEQPGRFGARDVTDLTWKQLLDAYTCTECGRCSSECPANQTGKKLSPRKIMMDTRDRVELVGKQLGKDGQPVDDGKALLGDYITEEEVWACTSCNACVEACPVNIDPLSIIVDLRRYLIMEESKSPESITVMFNNIENNGAPWAFSAMDRDKWKEELL
ncbi:MAG: (Fe-S)-binding protein [Flavobacteriales bacterium]|nr:(Fe-S)-binding protein [Flavobacteriales bacterium]